jgi:dienelactone hydrolase
MTSTTADRSTIRAPGAHLMALEWRAPFEAMGTLALWPLLSRGPRGDGHAVLVIPGLAAPDSSTAMLRRFLLRRGYDAHRWGQGFNFGPRPGVLEACLARVHALHRQSGRRISLVGWSLGGVYARELAKMAPDAVRCAISLGTPFAGPPHATNAWRVYEFVSGQRVGDHALHAGLHEAPPVPTTSIYSRTDGVVAWRCSIQAPARFTENIEVRASHVGMGAHAAVLHAVADRLGQPEGAWQPFRAEGVWRFAYGRARNEHHAHDGGAR